MCINICVYVHTQVHIHVYIMYTYTYVYMKLIRENFIIHKFSVFQKNKARITGNTTTLK